MKKWFLGAVTVTALLVACLAMTSAPFQVKADKENVVSSRLEGKWRPQAALTKRLTGKSKSPQGEAPSGSLSFKSVPSVAQKIPTKYKKFLQNKQIYMAGMMSRRGKANPFILIEHRGNPHIVYFRERGGDPMGDAESFNVILAVAKDKANDLLFIGGDFNNQPFSAYERVEKKMTVDERLESPGRLPVRAAGETYTVNGWEIEVRLVPDKTEIMIGEPIYLSFKVLNHSDQDLQLIEGGDYRNQLGRSESYSITTIREDSKLVPNPDAGQGMGGLRGPQKIPVKDSFVRKLFLPNWARFEEPGDYTITCKRTLNISRHTPNRWDEGEKTIDVDVEVSTKIKVTLPDKNKMGDVIATLGNAMLGDNYDDSEKAARALAYVIDEGAIEYLVKAIDSRRYGLKFTAIGALSKFNNNLALQGLKEAMATKASDIGNTTTKAVACTLADNIRHATACALAKSKHPEAISLLLSMWKDKAYGVRITVLHALGRMSSTESLSMLRKMTYDENELVSQEAERYLEIRTSKPEGS
jgi:hypothetical protein